MELTKQEKEKLLLAAEEITVMAAAVVARIDSEAEIMELKRQTQMVLRDEAEKGWFSVEDMRPTDGQIVVVVCADGWMQKQQYSNRANTRWFSAGRPVLYWHPVPSVRKLPGVKRNAWKLAEWDSPDEEEQRNV